MGLVNPAKKRSLNPSSLLEGHEWQEEPYVSPDGETFVAIVKVGDGEFSVRTNDSVWDATFEKIWYPKFSPDGRLTAICQQDMEWVLVADGEAMGETTDYIWDTMFSEDGSVIATMYKSMEQYGICVNGEPWETLYENANMPALSKDGAHTAAVVQAERPGRRRPRRVQARRVHRGRGRRGLERPLREHLETRCSTTPAIPWQPPAGPRSTTTP